MSHNHLHQVGKSTATPQPNSLLRATQVQKLVNIGKTRLANLMKEGKFPQPITICGGRTRYWLQSEIDAFVASEVSSHRAELTRVANDPLNILQTAWRSAHFATRNSCGDSDA
jgi:predicted DNA-binding transcriptional regulator AlpA